MSKIEKDLTIASKQGLHARPAALFVQIAEKFDSTVTVEKDDQVVNGKSIMGLLTLGAQCGVTLKVTIEGEDAVAAMTELEDFISTHE